MYKITVIAGPNRGSSYALSEGEMIIGRQSGNTVVLQSSKVSKQHCSLTVSHSSVTVKDLGSSNGTFVNGILIKVKIIKPGDRISVGEFVFELVESVKKKPSAAPSVAGMGSVFQIPGQNGYPGAASARLPQMPLNPSLGRPQDLKGKLIWMFENQVMPIFYGMNLKTEWNMICLGLFGVFLIINLLVSVTPLLEANRVSIVKEAGKRAQFIARQIAEHNAPFLAARAETKTEIGTAENAEGVRVAVLTDLDSRIIAPGSKINQYLAVGDEATAAVQGKERFRSGEETGFLKESDDVIVAVEPLKILSTSAGKNVVVGMAVVSVDVSLAKPDLGEMGVIYSEALILTSLLGGLILLILYRLTLKPYSVLNEDMDKALKGELSQVTHEFKLQEMDPLWEIINSAIQRIPKLDSLNGGGLGGANVDPSQLVEEFVGPLRMLGNVIKYGIVVFNSEKKIAYINGHFEEISGIRADAAIGNDIGDVARDQSMGPFISDLFGRVSVGGEGSGEDYDFSGISHKVYLAAFGAPGGVAKCYVLLAAKVEG